MASRAIDLNCDLGENYGPYQLHVDKELMSCISSANIACGWHAGDPVEMNRTVQLAKKNRISIGAHPSYPDLLGFGRRDMSVSQEELRYYLIYQIGALNTICKANDMELIHVKPHGSLYLNATTDSSVAKTIPEAIAEIDRNLIYVALGGPRGEMTTSYARRFGLRVAREGFPGRAYTSDGALVPRGHRDAVLTDPEQIYDRAMSLIQDQYIQTIEGVKLEMRIDTLCIPNETPEAVEIAKRIQGDIEQDNILISPLYLHKN